MSTNPIIIELAELWQAYSRDFDEVYHTGNGRYPNWFKAESRPDEDSEGYQGTDYVKGVAGFAAWILEKNYEH